MTGVTLAVVAAFTLGTAAGYMLAVLVRHLDTIDASTTTGGSVDALDALFGELGNRAWIRPGARVVSDLYGVGTVADPDVVYAVSGFERVNAASTGRSPVVFDADPLTVRWVHDVDVDPITPPDENRLRQLARRFEAAAPPSRDPFTGTACTHHPPAPRPLTAPCTCCDDCPFD